MANVAMPQVDALRETFAEPVKDIKLNLGNIAASDFLDAPNKYITGYTESRKIIAGG